MDTSLDRHEPPNLNQEEVNSLNKPLRKKVERVIKSFDRKKKKSPPQMDSQQNSLKLSKQIYKQSFLNYLGEKKREKGGVLPNFSDGASIYFSNTHAR